LFIYLINFFNFFSFALLQEVQSHSNATNYPTNIPDQLQNRLSIMQTQSGLDQGAALFLSNPTIVNCFSGILTLSKSPRIDELVIGIIANMAHQKVTIVNGASIIADLRTRIIHLLKVPDIPTLSEVVRLLRTCMADDSVEWSKAIHENMEIFIESTEYLISNCTNGSNLLTLFYHNVSKPFKFILILRSVADKTLSSNSNSIYFYVKHKSFCGNLFKTLVKLFASTENLVGQLLCFLDSLSEVHLVILEKFRTTSYIGKRIKILWQFC